MVKVFRILSLWPVSEPCQMCMGVLKWLYISYLNKQTTGYKLPHNWNWLVRLAIDLAGLCIICGTKDSPTGHVNFWQNFSLSIPLCGSHPPPHTKTLSELTRLLKIYQIFHNKTTLLAHTWMTLYFSMKIPSLCLFVAVWVMMIPNGTTTT